MLIAAFMADRNQYVVVSFFNNGMKNLLTMRLTLENISTREVPPVHAALNVYSQLRVLLPV